MTERRTSGDASPPGGSVRALLRLVRRHPRPREVPLEGVPEDEREDEGSDRGDRQHHLGEHHPPEGELEPDALDVARTVADCFKFRNKIGLDVALEALQESWRAKRVSMDELWRFAALCRVANVMRPYMESLS